MAKKIISDENWNIDYFNFLSVCICPSVFALFKQNKDMSYKDCFHKFMGMLNTTTKFSKKDEEDLMWLSLYAHDLAMFRQSVCLLENIMKNAQVDLAGDRFKTYLLNIRNNVTIEGGENLTNYNFIKLIRNTFAHNNELAKKPQLTFFDDPKENYIKFKIEEPSSGIKIIMGPEDMDALCNSLALNTKTPYFSGSSLAVRSTRLKNALLGKYFDVKKINRYMQSVKAEGEQEDLVLDEYQEKSITNYFGDGCVFADDYYLMRLCKGKPLGILLRNPALMNTVFPRTNNAVPLATQNYILLNAIYDEIRKNPNLSMNDMTTKFYEFTKSKDKDEQDFGVIASYILNTRHAMFLEISTALTTVLTNRDIEDLEDSYKAKFEDGVLHHIRNAMVHGTYFYDFDKKIEIYDGQKKLKHIATLDGDKVLGDTQELAHKRWKETFKEKVCDFNEK